MTHQADMARNVAGAIRRKGTHITLRRVTTSAAPELLPNPPTLNDPTMDGAALSGATTIAIAATEARGRLLAGDELIIDRVTYRVTATIESRDFDDVTPGFDAVTISPVLRANVADGAVITPKWAADQTIHAVIQSYPRRLIDGTMILARDLQVTIAAHNLAAPTETDKLIIDGDIRSIVMAVPAYARGVIMKWDIQAR